MKTELRELLELVMVEKVAMTKDRSSIRIYIVSPRLIHKKNIYKIEDRDREAAVSRTPAFGNDPGKIPAFGPVYAENPL